MVSRYADVLKSCAYDTAYEPRPSAFQTASETVGIDGGTAHTRVCTERLERTFTWHFCSLDTVLTRSRCCKHDDNET